MEIRRVVFLDLDDTIYDRTNLRLHALLHKSGLLKKADVSAAATAIEEVRQLGLLFERLGFDGLQHNPEQPQMLAILMSLYKLRLVGIQVPKRSTAAVARRRLRTYKRYVHGLTSSNWRTAFSADLEIEYAKHKGIFDEVIQWIVKLSEDQIVRDIADQLQLEQDWDLYPGVLEVWNAFGSLGAERYVVSEGDEIVQRRKLELLGVNVDFGSSLLTSDRAARPNGSSEIISLSDELLSSVVSHGMRTVEQLRTSSGGKDLVRIYPFRWLLRRFSVKTRDFYYRILGAVAMGMEGVAEAMDAPSSASEVEWRQQPMLLSMIGDNYMKDVRPLQLLLEDKVWFGLLRLGKHATRSKSARSPNIVQFDNWQDLTDFGVENCVPLKPIKSKPATPFSQSTRRRLHQAAQELSFPAMHRLLDVVG